MSDKPGVRLPLLSVRPAVTPATLKTAATNFCCLVNRGMMGVNSLPKTVTLTASRLRYEPRPSAPESSTLTTRLPSQPRSVSWCHFRSDLFVQGAPVTWCSWAGGWWERLIVGFAGTSWGAVLQPPSRAGFKGGEWAPAPGLPLTEGPH